MAEWTLAGGGHSGPENDSLTNLSEGVTHLRRNAYRVAHNAFPSLLTKSVSLPQPILPSLLGVKIVAARLLRFILNGFHLLLPGGPLLGTYVDEPVSVRTVSPVSETELVVEFDANGVVAAPEDAVLSFGVERDVKAPDGPVTPETMYGRFCPYSNGFASRDEYEQWAASNPEIISDVQPIDESLDLQADLLRDADSIGDGRESDERSTDGFSC